MEILDAMDTYYTSHDNRSIRNQHLIKSLLNLIIILSYSHWFLKKNYTPVNSILKIKPDDTLPIKIYNEINFEKLIELIEKEDPENSLLLSIYFLIVKTYSDKFDDINYNKLRELIIENLKVFDFDTCKYSSYWIFSWLTLSDWMKEEMSMKKNFMKFQKFLLKENFMIEMRTGSELHTSVL